MFIKAIETEYKGYRFRSRLEARWAVFFDELGVEFQYEKEGFELGDLGRYLPDFYLPESRLWVEIKPADARPTCYAIYAAGKIFRNCWRHQLLSMPSYDVISEKWGRYRIDGTAHSYVGPYFSCGGGHGMSHGISTHGVFEDTDSDHGSMNPERRSAVVEQCFEAIDRCDVFYAWIDSMDCYGTINEIGYAKAKGKLIWIGIALDAVTSDLWFAIEQANRVAYDSQPISALMKLAGSEWTAPEQKKIQAVARHRKEFGIVLYGDPMDIADDDAGLLRSRLSTDKRRRWVMAAAAARQARFEHGQTPRSA